METVEGEATEKGAEASRKETAANRGLAPLSPTKGSRHASGSSRVSKSVKIASHGGSDIELAVTFSNGKEVEVGRSRNPSSESDSSSSSSSLSLVEPPDGGWGWAVVAASFIAHMIADGCAFSFGVFYSEFLEVFGESRGKTAVVGSLFVAVPLMMGPIASAFTNRYGCRVATMVGGLIAGCGFISSSFANSIEVLCLTFGFFAGFGLSMVYVSCIVVVAFYFEKKRAFATGVAVAGTGIGTLIFAPLTDYLIDEYTWRGATLIIGGLMFNIIVAGTIFLPLTNPKLERQKRKYLENMAKFSRMSSRYNSTDGMRGGEMPLRSQNGSVGGELNTGHTQYGNSPELESVMVEPVTQSLIHFPTFFKKEIEPLYPSNSIEAAMEQAGKNGKTLQEVLAQHGLLDKFRMYHGNHGVKLTDSKSSALKANPSIITDRDPTAITSDSDIGDLKIVPKGCESENLEIPGVGIAHTMSINEVDMQKTAEFINVGTLAKRAKKRPTRSDFNKLLPMQRKDIFYRGSVMRTGTQLAETHKSASCPNIAMHYEDDDAESSTSDLFFCGQYKVCNFLKLSREAKNTFKRMLHVSIFRSSVFMYLCLSTFLLYFAYDVPYVFTPDMANEYEGVSNRQAALTVGLIGITSTLGQILLGWIGDLPSVNAIHLYNGMTSVAGILTMVVPWLHRYPMLCAYSACYGFFISANYALTTYILAQLLGMEKLTNAYGIIMLAEGVANLLGPPAFGFISDLTGDYDMAFLLAGIIIFISGFMLTLIPCLAKYDRISNYDNVIADESLPSEEDEDGEDDEEKDTASTCSESQNEATKSDDVIKNGDYGGAAPTNGCVVNEVKGKEKEKSKKKKKKKVKKDLSVDDIDVAEQEKFLGDSEEAVNTAEGKENGAKTDKIADEEVDNTSPLLQGTQHHEPCQDTSALSI